MLVHIAHRRPAVLAALVVALASAPSAGAAPPLTGADSALLACLEGNLDPYRSPASAVEMQHFGIESVCARQLEGVRGELGQGAPGSVSGATAPVASAAAARVPRIGRLADAPVGLLVLLACALAVVAGGAAARWIGRPRLSGTAAVVVLGAPFAAALTLAFEGGGFAVSSWGPVSIALLGLLGAAVLLVDARAGRSARVAVAGWGGLAVWQGVSSLWADDPSAAVAAMNLTILYGAGFTLALVAALAGARLRAASALAFATATAVAVDAARIRLFPSLSSGDVNGRLGLPITYSNGLGACLALGAVLAFGGATSRQLPRYARLACAAAIPLFSLDILFTSSRGAAVVAAAGVLAIVAFSPQVITAAMGTAAAVAVTAPVLLVAGTDHRLVFQGYPLPPHDAAGRRVAVILVASMLASMLVVPRCNGTVRMRVRPRVARAAVAVVLAAAAAGAAGAAQLGTARFVDASLGAVSRETPANASLGARLDAASTGRVQIWKVALQEFRAAPLTGTGAGDFRFRWRASGPPGEVIHNAHSVYLETLGESGLIGFALLGVVIGGIVVAMLGGRARAARKGRDHDRVVAVAACAAVAAHLAFDWDWQLPAVVLPAVALAGAVVGSAVRGGDPVRAPRVAVAGGALAVVAAILVVAGPTAAALRIAEARRTVEPHPARALLLARQAERLDPLDGAAFALAGSIEAELGRSGAADASLARALGQSPRDPTTRLTWAEILLRRGAVTPARRLLAQGFTLGSFAR